MDFNSLTLTGRVGSDPEIRQTGNGLTVASFRFANNRFKKQGTEQPARWYKATAFGKTAETVEKLANDGYLAKGSQLLLAGEHDYEEWTAKDGTIKTSELINISTFTLIGGKSDNASSAPSAPAYNDATYEGPNSNADWIEKRDRWVNRTTGEITPF